MIGPRQLDVPPPLVTAASLVAVEALLVVLFAVAELANVSSQRLTMGLTTSLFFAAYGAGLGLCAWALTRRRAWARGPVLLAQLIWLGLAWNFRGGDTLLVAIGLAVVAVVVIAGLLHPASMEALDSDRDA
ncbi:hypothetical protein DDE18_08380 [Nocardioides gansuensis]|uniref:Integral membrane protein n=1 Tax=Nocardioides gansuensis TaxID=2138300 RepID=A0A2T8FC76_9ACTN|nr:hypothetical protein [Nocardioides gansuensis]PVG83303.1 hypothetical protein DDE18_08380 [Nocardioides gansuensis]